MFISILFVLKEVASIKNCWCFWELCSFTLLDGKTKSSILKRGGREERCFIVFYSVKVYVKVKITRGIIEELNIEDILIKGISLKLNWFFSYNSWVLICLCFLYCWLGNVYLGIWLIINKLFYIFSIITRYYRAIIWVYRV
jgi:hypothetical protein